MLVHDIVIESDGETRTIGNGDPALIDDGRLNTLHHRRPPRHIERVILQHQEIQSGCGAVNAGRAVDRRTGVVHCHRDTFPSHVADFMRFEYSAYVARSGWVALDQRRVLQRVEGWMDDETRGLFLCGPCGTGKSHLAVSALLEFRHRRTSVRFASAQELILECRSCFRANNDDVSSILGQLTSVEALVLDDHGTTRLSGHKAFHRLGNAPADPQPLWAAQWP